MRWVVLAALNILCLSLIKVALVNAHISCGTERDCPKNLPFCTPVGCVFQCPANSFLNGTSCVLDCGEKYIFNNTCVSKCPFTHTVTEEHVVAIGLTFRRLQFCRSECPDLKYVSDGICVKSCPEDQKFIEGKTCVSKCSQNNTLYRNVTIGDRFIGTECKNHCNLASNYPFRQNHTCVSECEFVVFNGSCLRKCPEGANVHLDKTLCTYMGRCEKHWPDQVYCSEVCPSGYNTFNNTCVYSCPESARFVFNSKCLEKCPASHQYTSRYGGVCQKSCILPYRSNLVNHQCVFRCPERTKNLNGTCIAECPVNMFVNKISTEDVCVLECPKHMYIKDKSCVDDCPTEYNYIYKKCCVQECPEYTCPRKNTRVCLSDCPNKPSGKAIFDGCSEDFPFRRKDICVAECIHSEVINELRCINVTDCKKLIVFDRKCLDKCPFGYIYSSYSKSYEYSVRTNGHTTYERKYNPEYPDCQKVWKAYINAASCGLVTLLYFVWIVFFVSTKQCYCLKRDVNALASLVRRLCRCNLKYTGPRQNEGSTIEDGIEEQSTRGEWGNIVEDDDTPLIDLTRDNA